MVNVPVGFYLYGSHEAIDDHVFGVLEKASIVCDEYLVINEHFETSDASM